MTTVNMKQVSSAAFKLCVIASAAALVACGGGGGGSDGAGTGSVTPGPIAVSTPVVPAPEIGTLLSVKPVTAYIIGSAESNFISELNDERGAEFGFLTQSLELDKAAKNHALYLQTANIEPMVGSDGVQFITPAGLPAFTMFTSYFLSIDPVTGMFGAHIQKKGTINFTGVTPADRAIAAGYKGIALGDVIAQDSPKLLVKTPCVAQLLGSVFHRSAMLNVQLTDVGIGLNEASNFFSRSCVIQLGFGTTARKAPDGWIGIYPRDESKGISRAIWVPEAPNPAPEFSISGYPVSIYSKPGTTLKVNGFTLTGPNGSVQTKLVQQVDNPKYLKTNEAYLVPNGPLARNATYTVTFSGSANGASINRTWKFTTVADDDYCDKGGLKVVGCK